MFWPKWYKMSETRNCTSNWSWLLDYCIWIAALHIPMIPMMRLFISYQVAFELRDYIINLQILWRLAYHIYTVYTYLYKVYLWQDVGFIPEPFLVAKSRDDILRQLSFTCPAGFLPSIESWYQTPCADVSLRGVVLLFSEILEPNYPNYFAVLLMFLQQFVIAWLPYCCRSSCCDVCFRPWNVPFSSFFWLGYNFVLSACDKSMKWQHALEIFTTLKSKRLEATLSLGVQTWAFRGPWRQNHLWETTSWAILQLASTSWRG